MYLKSLVIENFRKFGTENNKIDFVDAKSIQEQIQDLKEENKINIAPTTTLIVGKNNCGKSTIIKALDNLINNEIKSFGANDFNYIYLERLLDQYVGLGTEFGYSEKKKNETPFLQFIIIIGIENDSDDLVTNLVPFMRLEDVDNSELVICTRLELANDEVFMKDIRKMLEKSPGKQRDSNRFRQFLKIIDDSNFKLNYYNVDNGIVENFKLKHLIELRPIKANNIEGDSSLSKAFNRIIEYRYKALLENDSNALNDKIIEINAELTDLISESHTKSINQSLEEIESSEKLKMLLRADLSFKKVLNNLITYEYVERDLSIPENQFGLGYTNLMMIIADLIDYMERYPENSFNSKVNLISIEEPETFMHPQMQEMFIKNINETIASLMKGKNKNVNSQLIITTHSSHILNSKIHSGNTFNNINYITTNSQLSCAVNLHDDIIIPDKPISTENEDNPDPNKKENDLKFLKKHIKYKVSELFFSDAVIFVEGVTEETLLKYYIDRNNELNKYYISIFNIDGAHGLVYHHLIKLLNVPTLIITDLDIRRTKEEQDNFEQLTDIKGRLTTNKTIKKYNGNSDELENLPGKIEDGNLYIAYQGQIKGYYATSFEEAFILTNYKNDLLNNTLKKMKPNIYGEIIGGGNDKTKVKENSYKLQRKLSSNKSDFANELLYRFITETDEETIPDSPKYIKDGISWLSKKLVGGR